MKALFFVLITIMMSCCGAPKLRGRLYSKTGQTGAEDRGAIMAAIGLLGEHEATFKRSLEEANIPINIHNDLKKDTGYDGVCRSYPDGSQEILIDRGFWNRPSCLGMRPILLIHEVGHCVFKLGHHSDPQNIMHPTLPNSICSIETDETDETDETELTVSTGGDEGDEESGGDDGNDGNEENERENLIASYVQEIFRGSGNSSGPIALAAARAQHPAPMSHGKDSPCRH